MIVKNGEIIAIGKVKHDDTLSGTGISDDKLGLSQKVRDAIGNKQNKLTPADNTIAISNDQIRVNTSGISAQQIHPSVFDPYASKEWVSQGFLSSTALDSYALSADVRNEFDASAAWINERFDNVPGAETYYGGNGIEVIGHQINLTADVVSHDELNQASAAAFNTASSWVTDQHYLKDADLNNYATKEYVREASAAAVSTTEDWVEGQGYLTSVSLEPYAKTSDVNAQFNATSAWALDTFFKTSEYFYAVSGTDSSSEYFNWTEDTLSASWKVKHFNLSFNYVVKPVSASPDFIYSRMQVGNTTIDDRHYVEGYSDTVSYNVSFNIYNADDKTYKFAFSAENDKLSLENLQISCIGFIDPRSLRVSFGFMEDGNLGNFVDSDGNNLIFVEKLPVG